MLLSNKKLPERLKLKKVQTGINGLDEITNGGLPKNRPTIISGSTGSGKTIMSMEFLVKGVTLYDEPGAFLSFEEDAHEIVNNMLSFNFGLESLVKKNKIYIEYLDIDKSQFIEAGRYDLEGLFVRLKNAIKKTKAKRVVLDSLDTLFYGLDSTILRSEITRLFRWLKQLKVTSLVTLENDDNLISKVAFGQYAADCVIALDSRVIRQIATRRLRILKMRGSVHGINEYPFLIDDNGMSVLPLISELKNHTLSSKRITSGIKDLDGMLDGKGYFEGSSILVSGSAGTGKTSIAVSLIKACSIIKKRCLYCAFEESTSQITRNMASVGLGIEIYIKAGILRFYSSRPNLQNLELHLISIKRVIDEFQPEIIVLDPVTNLMSEGINSEIRQMLANFIDYLKSRNITTLLTAAITLETIKGNPSDEGISAMVDTWILVRDIEQNKERNRGIYVLKSRGMSHSTQIREFLITDHGISILPIYVGRAGILTGSAKLENKLAEEEDDKLQREDIKNKVDQKRKQVTAKVDQLNADLKGSIEDLQKTEEQIDLKRAIKKQNEEEISALRNKINSYTESLKDRNK